MIEAFAAGGRAVLIGRDYPAQEETLSCGAVAQGLRLAGSKRGRWAARGGSKSSLTFKMNCVSLRSDIDRYC